MSSLNFQYPKRASYDTAVASTTPFASSSKRAIGFGALAKKGMVNNAYSKDRVEFSSTKLTKKSSLLATQPTIHSRLLEISPAAIAKEGSRIFVDPAERSKIDPSTRKLAFKQALAARNLLYFPGSVLNEQFAKAATSLQKIVKELNTSELQLLTKAEFGEGGFRPDTHPNAIHSILKRLVEKSATATDRMVFISVMSNLGHNFIDKYGSNQRSTEALESFRPIAESKGLPYLSIDKIKKLYSLTHFRNSEPRKRNLQPAENDEERVNRTKNRSRFPLRTGVHDLGQEVDNVLGVAIQERIPKIRWNVGFIDSKLVADTKEPLVDLVASRLPKALMIWDLLCGEEPENAYKSFCPEKSTQNNCVAASPIPKNKLIEQGKLARLAGGGAYNLASGYHSAFEIIGVGVNYLGRNYRNFCQPKQEPTDVFGNGVATHMAADLFNQHSNNLNSKPHSSQRTFLEVEKYLSRAAKK